MSNNAITKKQEHSKAFWSHSIDDCYEQLNSTSEGITQKQAKRRLKQYGPNRLSDKNGKGYVSLFLSQFKNSIILILLFATGLSFFLNDHLDAAIILSIVLMSGCLGFWQEKGAANAVKE